MNRFAPVLAAHAVIPVDGMIASPDAMIDEAAIAKGLRFDGLAGNVQTVPARQQLISNGVCSVSQVRV